VPSDTTPLWLLQPLLKRMPGGRARTVVSDKLQLTLLKAAVHSSGQSMSTLAPFSLTADARSPQLCAIAWPASRFSDAARHDTSPRLSVRLTPMGGSSSRT
jgi:hypothetical protein